MAAPNYASIINNSRATRQERANALINAYSVDADVMSNNAQLAINSELRRQEREKQEKREREQLAQK